MDYAELCATSNFTFLTGASHPEELVERAHALGYRALALTDDCSLAGGVRAHVSAKERDLHLIIGSRLRTEEGHQLVALVTDRAAYAELSGLITLARRRAAKGEYRLRMDDLRFRLKRCLVIWLPDAMRDDSPATGYELKQFFGERLYMGMTRCFDAGEAERWQELQALARQVGLSVVACGQVEMHSRQRKPLHDVLAAVRLGTPVQKLGRQRQANAELCLKPLRELAQIYPLAWLQETVHVASQCRFSLDELRYQYPAELVPEDMRPIQYLRQLVEEGAQLRWPEGVSTKVRTMLDREFSLIEELDYEYFFLTVHDLVRFARSRGILCQGRGSAANSVVCYCLHITEVSPDLINVLFERFISKERDEPPDIDVDFESQRREEVIQYIYRKYSRKRAALAATVITYRSRSAVRDVGKALGLSVEQVDKLAKSLAWWDRSGDIERSITGILGEGHHKLARQLFVLVEQIRGFPRHLSQHVGGFVIAQDQVSDLVPVENAAMPERTLIQWDKTDLESLRRLNGDRHGLGMLSALRRTLEMVRRYDPQIQSLADIPKEDPATYAMLSRGDSIGVFQVESRAQMSMLPRLRPQAFYDLVIQIAIVRPGPIQGDMVVPYLRRRNGEEEEQPPSEELREVLRSTLGVPIFQEQAIRIAMVAAGFSGGEADQLRRAMASWGKNGNLMQFEQKFIQGMLSKGYAQDYANRLFDQIKGFGGYGFPESHSASFALLTYASSWLKCHHPAAFYCALLNSQPMGFYTPSQLVQDARGHQIKVLPVDVRYSDWENSLSDLQEGLEDSKPSHAIRLGLCRVANLREEVAVRIVDARAQKEFVDTVDLARRATVPREQMQCLAAADALQGFSRNRYQSHWQVAGIEPLRPLLIGESDRSDGVELTPPSIEQDVGADYATLGLTLRTHPMALLRHQYPFHQCKRQSELGNMTNGRFVRVAGLVTGRQRPQTAKGTIFLTLEDETGNINVIVWKRTQEYFRQALLNARLLVIKGRLEIAGMEGAEKVMHVIAGSIYDYSDRIKGFRLKSRDFH